jgi:hypothetical protein
MDPEIVLGQPLDWATAFIRGSRKELWSIMAKAGTTQARADCFSLSSSTSTLIALIAPGVSLRLTVRSDY